MVVASAQTHVNPATQVTWPAVSGTGTPAAGGCTTNYAQPYTDTSAPHYYICTPSGWYQVDGAGAGGTVSDGAGTTTANQLAVSTTTAHTLAYAATLPTAAVPAFTGDSTNAAGSLATTVVALRNLALPTLAASTGYLYDNNGTLALQTPSGSGTVNSGTAFSPAYYPATGAAVSGTTPFAGLGYWSTTTAPAAATAAQVVGVIGATAVQNAQTSVNFSGSLAGDVTGRQSATVVGKLNGSVVPASATVIGSNASAQLISQTGTIANSTTGNAATASSLATAPTTCSATQAATGIAANGNAVGCFTPAGAGNVSGSGASTVGHFAAFNNTTATAINDTGYSPNSFDAAGAAAARAGTGACTSGQYENADGTGGPTCAQVAYGQVSGTPTIPTSANWPNAGTCTAGQYVDALTNGTTPTCAQVAYSQISGTVGTAAGGTSLSNPSGYIYFNGGSAPATSTALMHNLSFSDMSTTTYASSQVIARYISGISETLLNSGVSTIFGTSCTPTFALASATTSGSTFIIQYNGAQIGTVAFSAGTSTGPTISLTQTSVTSGGVLAFLAPSTSDSTAAGLYGSVCVTY